MVCNLQLCYIDFTNELALSKLDDVVYMEMPLCFCNRSKQVPRLTKSPYVLRQAPRTWRNNIINGLTSRGLQQFQIDPCLYICGYLLVIHFVNGMLLFSPRAHVIDEPITSLSFQFILTDKETI